MWSCNKQEPCDEQPLPYKSFNSQEQIQLVSTAMLANKGVAIVLDGGCSSQDEFHTNKENRIHETCPSIMFIHVNNFLISPRSAFYQI